MRTLRAAISYYKGYDDSIREKGKVWFAKIGDTFGTGFYEASGLTKQEALENLINMLYTDANKFHSIRVMLRG